MNNKYQVMPDMSPEQFEALKQDIAERGILTPIDLDEEGNVLDGHHRIRACKEFGITDYPTIIRPGLSEEEKRMFARKSNMMRRHLSRKQIREIIRLQLIDSPRWADNRIAKELGVDSKTVRNIRGKLEATSEIPKLDKFIGADGKERPGINKRGIMAANEMQREQILKELKEGGIDTSQLPEEFLDSGMVVIKVPPPTGKEKERLDEWSFFLKIMIEEYKIMPPTHLDWLARKYKDPEDFMKNWPPPWISLDRKKTEKRKRFEEDALKRIKERRINYDRNKTNSHRQLSQKLCGACEDPRPGMEGKAIY